MKIRKSVSGTTDHQAALSPSAGIRTARSKLRDSGGKVTCSCTPFAHRRRSSRCPACMSTDINPPACAFSVRIDGALGAMLIEAI